MVEDGRLEDHTAGGADMPAPDGRAPTDLAAVLAAVREALADGRTDEARRLASRPIDPARLAEDDLAEWLWVLRETGESTRAIPVALALLRRRGADPDQLRHLASDCERSGRPDHAATFAERASDAAPERADFALAAAGLCLRAGRAAAVVPLLARSVRAVRKGGGERIGGLRAVGDRQGGPGAKRRAARVAPPAVRAAPADRATAQAAAEHRVRLGDWAGAAAILDEHLGRAGPEPRVLRQYSGILAEDGRLADALGAIDGALRLDGRPADYHLHRGGLLLILDRPAEAADALSAAVAREPARPAIRRMRVHALAEAGRMEDAIAEAGVLLQHEPGNIEYAGCMMHLISTRQQAGELAPVSSVVAAKRGMPPRPPRPEPGFLDLLGVRGRVIGALVLREMRTRFGETRIGYAWALLEPTLHIASLAIVFNIMFHGRPPIGEHFFLFYFTGIAVYHMFTHTTSAMTHAIVANRSLLQLPLVTNIDAMTARGLLEFVTDMVVAGLLIGGFLVFGIPALPHDPLAVLCGMAAVWFMAFGFGCVNAVLGALSHSWSQIWQIVLRFLYFGSGIFYVPAKMPVWVRDVLQWNPLLHGVDWVRSGFYPDYEPVWLNKPALLVTGLAALLTGLLLERVFRRRLSEDR